MKFKKSLFVTGMLTSLALCAPYIPSIVSADDAVDTASEAPVFSDDFESETISGWSVLGGVGTMGLDKTKSKSGSACLSISDREQPFNGPAITVSQYIDTEETYRITGWVYNSGSQSETIHCTLKLSDSVNVDDYRGIAVIEAQPSEWTYFEGTVDTPEDVASALLYFESPNIDLNFSIDDICLYGKAPEGANNNAGNNSNGTASVSSYVFDFESGFGDWGKRGDTRIIRTDEQQHEGSYSILSTNRQKVWNGPTVSIDSIARGVEYQYEANVLYTEKKADDTHTFFLELQYSYEGSERYEVISTAEVQKNVWTKISGPFTVPEGAANVMLYVQTADLEDPNATPSYTDLVSFYVDDVSAVRSDLAGSKNIAVPVIIVIAAGVAAMIILIVVVSKTLSAGSKKKDDNEGVDGLINALNENSSKSADKPSVPVNAAKPAPKTEDRKSEDKKPEAKKPEDKKPEAKMPEDKKPEAKKPEDKKPEAKKPEDKKPEAKKPENKKSEAKTPDLEKKEPAKEKSTENKSQNSGNSANKNENSNNNKKKNKNSSDSKPVSSDKSEKNESKKTEKPVAMSLEKKTDDSAEKKNEKPAEKKADEAVKEPKTDTSIISDDSRANDIFNIETFSYEEENVRYDEKSGDQIADDDPLEAPGDLFDGF